MNRRSTAFFSFLLLLYVLTAHEGKDKKRKVEEFTCNLNTLRLRGNLDIVTNLRDGTSLYATMYFSARV